MIQSNKQELRAGKNVLMIIIIIIIIVKTTIITISEAKEIDLDNGYKY